MALQSHLYRRGASYVWRRRWPVLVGGHILQISLRTNEPLLAQRLAAIVTVESNSIFDTMTSQGLSQADARKFLEHIILREQAKIALLRADSQSPATSESNHAHDWAMGTALKLLSQHGPGAAPLADQEAESLCRDGRSAYEIGLLRHNLVQHANLPKTPPNEGQGIVITQQMRAALGRDNFNAAEFVSGRNNYIRGRAAAYIQAARDDSLGFDDAIALADQLTAARGSAAPAPMAVVAPAPISQQALSDADTVAAYDPSWPALIARFAELKRRRDVSELMIAQMGKVYMLFAEVTGITDLREIRQTHLARFVDTLRDLPKHYRKSPKDHEKPLALILQEAKGLPEDQRGLSTTTINRNLSYLGQLFTKAASEGYPQLKQLDTSSLRPRKKTRDRDARPSLTAPDIIALFDHPIWRGHGKGKSWNQPGTLIEGDGLYWLPLIAAMTGARRAEVAGLAPDDIGAENGVAFFWFRPNALRGVKTLASARKVPVHQQLIDLGLIARAHEMAARDGDMLFPDQRMPDEDKLGEKIDYKFRIALTQQLDGARDGMSFHSLRHYLNSHMARQRVPVELRRDILGHVGKDVNTERYTDTHGLDAMQEVIAALPPIAGILRPNSHDRSGFGSRPLFSDLGMKPYAGQFITQAKAVLPPRNHPSSG